MNILTSIFKDSYDELWKAIIRPYRDDYNENDLGPKKFLLNNKFYKRSDFSLINYRNMKLKCSHWEPYDQERVYNKLPCVMFLHGNSSSRCEVVPNLKYLLPLNITVFSFDFAGCGKSSGEYISLGWYETLDVQCVINFLRKNRRVSTIGLWGRSMGAVTALMAASKDPTIGGIFLDSPFYSLDLLINELSETKVRLPNFLVKKIISMIKQTVKEKANFNIDDIETVEYTKKCFVPSYFCHGKFDNFVNPHHSNDLYLIYPGEKSFLLVDGEHNSIRPNELNEKASEFFYNALKCRYIKEINDYYFGHNIHLKDFASPETPKGKDNKIIVNNKIFTFLNYGEIIPIEEDFESKKSTKIEKGKEKMQGLNSKIVINNGQVIFNNYYNIKNAFIPKSVYNNSKAFESYPIDSNPNNNTLLKPKPNNISKIYNILSIKGNNVTQDNKKNELLEIKNLTKLSKKKNTIDIKKESKQNEKNKNEKINNKVDIIKNEETNKKDINNNENISINNDNKINDNENNDENNDIKNTDENSDIKNTDENNDIKNTDENNDIKNTDENNDIKNSDEKNGNKNTDENNYDNNKNENNNNEYNNIIKDNNNGNIINKDLDNNILKKELNEKENILDSNNETIEYNETFIQPLQPLQTNNYNLGNLENNDQNVYNSDNIYLNDNNIYYNEKNIIPKEDINNINTDNYLYQNYFFSNNTNYI